MRIDSSYSLFNTSNNINSYNFYSSLVNYSNLSTRTQNVNNSLTDISSIYTNSLDTDYLDNFQSQLSDLSTEAESLITEEADSVLNTTEESDSVFSERIASSSNTDVLTASADTGATTTEYEVQVNQLAQAQVNESASFDSDVASSFTTGDNTIQLSQGGQSEEININVLSSDTNSDVLNKLEDEINNSELDLSADIVTNDDGTQQLQVESNATGTSDKFAISDVSGDLATQTNLDNTVQAAQDAEYEVNGESQVSTSNQLEIDNGQLSFDLQSTGSSTITVSPDNESVTEAAQSFVDQFNDTIGFLRDNIQQSNSLELAQNLTSITESSASDLDAIGIESRIDGTLSLNEEEFSQSLEENYDEVKETLGSVTGVASQVNDQVENTLSGPISEYSQLSEYSLYNQSGQSIFPFSSMYSGALFDSYF
ncbi:flagellar filament capping protein FliD [Halanaerobacter jeridensis]|uniref:Flagellar hook-associated protein 2 n=1 Tax=Halanaerobacter jeridensis TaxID=706427 RepID=A0A938XSM6_9FIRM|nr:flagellar filament capping protein FliD [Halanaerobacter jeridensis]MBM7556099.1 flagellar hook-associated protein 2 [Halanaerobacter jeridensis]